MVKSFNEWPNTNMKKMKITYRELEQAIKLLQSPDKEINSLGIELLKFYNISVFYNQILKDEKCCRNVFITQNIQRFFNISVLIACVKGQIDDLIVCIGIGMTTVNIICIIVFNKRKSFIKAWLNVLLYMFAIPLMSHSLCLYWQS